MQCERSLRARVDLAGRSRGALLKRAGLVLSALVMVSVLAPAAPPTQSLLLGHFGSNLFEPPELEPHFPTGARRSPPGRPSLRATECSLLRPVCVHGTESAHLSGPLADLEEAYDAVVLGLRAPAPLPDADGGSPALDLYLEPGAAPLVAWPELALGRSDRAPAFCVAGEQHRGPPLALGCLAQASLVALDGAETPALRVAAASYLAWLAHGPDTQLLDAVDRAQRSPHLALLGRDPSAVSPAGGLFFAHLETLYGSGRRAEAVLALFSQSRRDEMSDGLRWNNSPDVMDVVRNAFDNDAARFADVALDFAVARLFLGDRSDGTHAPDAAWLGAFGRVRFDWVLPHASLPRNVRGPRPLEPLGAAYVWLDTAGLPPNTELAASFTWEAPVRFRWSVVAIDAQGRELRRFDVPFFDQGRQVEKSLLTPEGAVGLVFVGTQLGSVHPDYPFDPDHEPWEPHAYELYVAKL